MQPYPLTALFCALALFYLSATLTGGLLARLKLVPLQDQTQRIGCVDGLRGYLALSVLAHHFIIWLQVSRLGGTWSFLRVPFFEQLGNGSVDLFFMATGLVFYPRIHAGFFHCPWPRLFISRIFRLLPLITLSFALVTALIIIRSHAGFDSSLKRSAYDWIILNRETPILHEQDSGRINAYVLWSLHYEWLFYLLLLPLFALIMQPLRKISFWVLPPLLLGACLAAQYWGNRFSLLNFLPFFMIGMLAFECQRSARLAKALRSKIAMLVAIAALLASMISYQPYFIALVCMGFFFTCIACGNNLWGLLSTPAAILLGECSYGIYLLHGIMLDSLFTDFSAPLTAIPTHAVPFLLPLLPIILLPVTAIIYRYFELPCIRAGHRLGRVIPSLHLAQKKQHEF